MLGVEKTADRAEFAHPHDRDAATSLAQEFDTSHHILGAVEPESEFSNIRTQCPGLFFFRPHNFEGGSLFKIVSRGNEGDAGGPGFGHQSRNFGQLGDFPVESRRQREQAAGDTEAFLVAHGAQATFTCMPNRDKHRTAAAHLREFCPLTIGWQPIGA